MITVWLGAGAKGTLLQEAAAKAPYETGGVLMGWTAGDDICISDVIGPGPEATHERTSFLPDHPWQAEQIAMLYEKSGRRLAYLGDWHTHPRSKPIPSATDRSTLRAIAKHKNARCPRPMMAILGQPEGDTWMMQCHMPADGRILRDIRVQQARIIDSPALQGWSKD